MLELYRYNKNEYKTILYRNYSNIANRDLNNILFTVEDVFEDENNFVLNYSNPICGISKSYWMCVITKDEYKVSIKLFTGSRVRKVSKLFFKVRKSVKYFTFNLKTGDSYYGILNDYNLKKKKKPFFYKNNFHYKHLDLILNHINNTFSSEITDRVRQCFYDFTGISNEIDLVKKYLDIKKIKYPDNFYAFYKTYFNRVDSKLLNKHQKRLVDAFMNKVNIRGSVVKKILHKTENLNIFTYKVGVSLFGDEWMNQDEDIILKCFNYSSYSNLSRYDDYTLNLMSKKEKYRVLKIFKEMIGSNEIGFYSFLDHIKLYNDFILYGNKNIKWKSDTIKSFKEEHIKWADEIEYYRSGEYFRVYPKYFYSIEKENNIGGEIFFFKILDNSRNYNEESEFQSNCVKNYLGRSRSFIVSVRKKDVNYDSIDRATVEYGISKDLKTNKIITERVQFLGRFNKPLSEKWSDVLNVLDCEVDRIHNDEKFETVKIKKVCSTGIELFSDSYWSDKGKTFWSYKNLMLNE